jgi:hypothetical protein
MKTKKHFDTLRLKNNFSIFLAIIIFSLIAVFGLSLITGNKDQTNIGNSLASATEPADINNDNKVDVFDLSILLSKWNTNDLLSDLNKDGSVNVFDLSILLSKWGVVSNPVYNPGAQIPISYDITTLPGTKRYVAVNGNDTTGTGTVISPYASLSKAISVSANNDSIIIRGGTYRQGNISIPATKTLHIAAYPGETPIFNGAQAASSGWITEGSLQYRSYTPMPVTDGSGISFTTGQNLSSDGVGKFPDQAWVGGTQLKQVTAKTYVTDGRFWVDSTNDRVYLSSNDIAKGGVEISNLRLFLSIFSPNTVIEGIKITRYSNSASDYGVVKLYNTSDNSKIRNVEISDTSFIALMYIGDSNLLNGNLLKNVTLTRSNWMGVSAVYTDNLTLDSVKITNMNQFDEFTYSPQSGALKTSRTRYTKVINSEISNNRSHGLWFDQSNVDVDVAGNRVVDNLGTGVFFEISDDLLLINNYIKATGGARATRLAGSSGLKIINNTIVGGADVLGIFTDVRSMPGCADPSKPLCADSYNSDRDSVRALPSTLDWMPRLDYMINNIIAYSTNTGWCGNTTMCISVSSSEASAPIETIIHKADSSRGIPQTFIDGNVFANGTNRLINASNVSYYSLTNFNSAMAASPVFISGIEANGKFGNSWINPDGSPTSTLSSVHNQAIPVPTNANVNMYIPAGTRYYGVIQ